MVKAQSGQSMQCMVDQSAPPPLGQPFSDIQRYEKYQSMESELVCGFFPNSQNIEKRPRGQNLSVTNEQLVDITLD